MDSAVALVQAYLHVNGYFTVLEYPILKILGENDTQTVTDLDILGFRFPGAGREVHLSQRGKMVGDVAFAPDPRLGAAPDQADMIVGEVKEGPARFNQNARDPRVLAAALARFGCCSPEHVPNIVKGLLAHGRATTHAGHAVRLIAFGTSQEEENHPYLVIPMDHVIRFLKTYVHDHWKLLRGTPLKHPALGFLCLLEKAESAGLADQKRGNHGTV